MPHSIKSPEQLAHAKNIEISDFPDKISDSTVAFAACKAIPEIVQEVGDSPRLSLRFGSITLENGMSLNPSELMHEPDVQFIDADGTYTLMMIDPDAPTPHAPKYRSWIHWLVINIPAHDISRGEEVEAYMPPEPGKHRHRYLFLLFKQQGRVKMHRLAKRQGFQVKSFAEEHRLGNPCNGLFFWCSSDQE